MKKLLLLIPLALIAAGCNTTTFTYTGKDGSTQTLRNSRAAWSSESYDWSYTTNGWHASANKSGPDQATVQAIAGIVNTMAMMKP